MFLSPGESSVVLVPHRLTCAEARTVLERPIHNKDFDPEGLNPLKFRWITRLKRPRALGGVAAWGHPGDHGTTH